MRKFILYLAIVSLALTTLWYSPPISAAPGNTWGDYSMMFSRSAGQFHSGGQPAGQWAWNPQSATISDVSWGHPSSWPPNYAERFIISNNWVLIDGFSTGSGQPVTQRQRVTSEKIGDINCQNMQSIPSEGGLQHYVQWNIPSTGYCLDAVGTITSTTSGKVVRFRHRQRWHPPAACSNLYYSARICIVQREQWWDDNGHSYGLQLDRKLHLAKGLGMAFKVQQSHPTSWSAAGRYYWLW